MKKQKSRGAWERKLLALAVASCFAAEVSYANPVNPTVTHGKATFAAHGNTLTVTNTPGAIINWQSFGIASQEITKFLQQSGASAVLNRVTGATPSTILGQLQSNGRVFLINPNGITIGKGAVIDVAGFVASSHRLSDDNFLAGRHRFTEAPGTASSVVNHGEITTSKGGMVYLVGQNIENHGVIRTPQGQIVLAAGKSIELVDAGTPEIRVQVTAPDNQALNLGQLFAAGGHIGMYAGLVRHGGTANANTAVVGENGKIVFKAVKDVKLEAGSVTTASGPTAGSIKVEAQTGTAIVAGTVEANATAGRGGSIDISGQQGVTVEPSGRLSADGVRGGTIALNSSAGGVEVSGQLSANATRGRGGQIAIVAATQAAVAAGAKVSVNGPKGGGSISVEAIENVKLESDSKLDARGAVGGTIAIAAEQGSVEVNGTLEATGTTSSGGVVKVAALSDITLGDTSVLNVSGKRGGETWIEAREGATLASGLISAYGHDGPGGKVLLLGPRVGLVRNAIVNASGYAGGGIVLVGGDYQGKNPHIQNAERTYVGPGVRIVADAIDSGDGGKTVIWSDEITRYYGEIRARGGARSGNGGFVEVSGKQFLHFNGKADVRAPRGRDGTVLLDPRDILVQDLTGVNDGQVTASSDERVLFADGAAGDFTISDEALEALQGSVVLQATRDITIDAGLSGGGLVLLNQGAGERVVFQAGRHITIGSAVKTSGAAIWLEADSPHANGFPTAASTTGADGKGALRINAAVQSFDSDPATGGKITMIAGTNTQGGTNGGGFALNADVNGGAGGIDVALSNPLTGELSFLIGSQGQAQFTTSDTGRLLSTGQLKIGEATTAGSDGLGLDAQTIKVDQLSLGATAGGPVTLAETAGTSLVVTAGSGGILVGRPLSTNQPTSIETTGPLTINQPVTTNGETLSISAASISGADQITGTGTVTCTGTGCPGATVILWDGGGNNLDWFTAANWSGDVVPTSADAVALHSSSGTVLISGGAASIKSLIADVPISISGTGSLTLAQASQFTEGFTLSGSLLGTGAAAVSGNTGNLTWNGGTMGTGGTFTLGVGASGTLSGSLTLNRTFLNSSVLALSGATIGGTGTLENSGTLSALGTNVVNVGLTNPINALIQVQGSLTVSSFPTNNGRITVGNGGTFSTGGASLANAPTSSLAIEGGNFSSAEATVTTDGSGNLELDGALSAGAVTLAAAGSGGVILASGATVTASGIGDTIVISGATFTNNAGNSALNPGSGRWLVYSANPAGNTFGGLLSSNQAIWGRSYPAGVTETGNRYVFSVQPTLTFSSTDAVKTYGAAADVSGNYTVTGFVDASLHGGVFTQDTALNTFIGAPVVTSAGAAATAHRADGNLGLGLFSIDSSTATVTATTGYAVASSSVGQLTVNPAGLTVTGNTTSSVYTAGAQTNTFSTTGLLGLDSVTGVSGRASGTNVGTYNDTLSAATGTGLGNYTITYNNGALTVTPAVISLAGTRMYDGATAFGPSAFGTVSGVNGETLVLAGGGSVASPRVSSYTLGLGTLSLTNGTGLASNYTLTGGSHTGTITPNPGNFRWVAGSGGNWDVAANWNQGVVPVGGAIVTIPDVGAPGISETITYRSGITNIKSIVSSERLGVSGGTLNLGVEAGDVSSIPEVRLAGGTLGGNGTLNVAKTDLLAGGVLTGSRTIVGNVNNSAGTVAPGNSPGILTIDGNYTQGAGGMLAIEIAGPTPGTQHDQLVVTGSATLGGTLRVSLPGGYVPAQGATHSVVEAGTISGTFSTTQYQPTLGLTTAYLASSVKVAATATNPGQILNEQVDSTQSAPPNTNAEMGGATPTGSGAPVPTGNYLETPTGQVVPLSPVASVDPGIYVNVNTGDTTVIGTGSTPPPGIYLNPETQTVLVVRVDPETGQTEIMSGSSSAVGSGARVRKVAACM